MFLVISASCRRQRVRSWFVLVLLIAAAVSTARTGGATGPQFQTKQIIYNTNLSPSAPNQPMILSGLSTNGSMTGYFIYSSTRQGSIQSVTPHAFLWDAATQTLSDLNATLDASSSIATCMSPAGIVGGVGWGVGVEGLQFGYIVQGGAVTTFTSPDGSDIDAVVAVNDGGQAVATYFGAAGYKRAFLWDGTNSTDLGDLGDPDNSFIWPQSINQAGQIIGTVYATDGIAGNGIPSSAFLYQTGVMNPLDVDGDYDRSVGTSINSAGQAVCAYSTGSVRGHQQTFGAFYTTGTDTTDLGTLSSYGDVVPFLINDLGQVYGTAYASDDTLHLFQWQGGAMADFGGVMLNPGDEAFGLTGVNSGGNMVGFLYQSDGSAKAGWRSVDAAADSAMHDLATLLPAGLGYVADAAEGTSILVNEMGRVACSGYSQGQPVVLLLLPDTDGDGIPDEWETLYGLNPLDASDASANLDGDGLTALQKYQQGLAPGKKDNPALQLVVTVLAQ